MRHLGLLALPIVFLGCVSSQPRVAPVPQSAWRAAADSPRSSEPTTVHRDPVRYQPSTTSLSREQVLAIANKQDPQDAIAEIDRHPLGFPLTNQNIGWFEDRVTPPELVDYLRKRAAVDWQALNTPAPSPSPSTTTPQGYATWEQPAPAEQPSTVYVVESPQPTTVIYQRSYSSSPGYYPSSYYPSTYCGPTYAPSYYGSGSYGGGSVYVGGSITVGRGTYVRPRTSYVYNQSSYTYRPGVPAGVFTHPNHVTQPVRVNTVVRTGNPTVVVQSRGGRGGRGR